MMNRKHKIIRIIALFLIVSLFLGSGRGNTVTSEAAKVKYAAKVIWQMKKGNTKKILTIVNKSSLKKKKKKKCSNLKWKSDAPKIVKVINNKKIQAKKAGSTYIRGYNKKKKRIVSIRVTVTVPEKPSLIRATSNGAVKGMKSDAGTAMIWYGIPYGADTGGANRWKAPRPVPSWNGEKLATKKMDNAVRSNGDSYEGTEDCLYVNVYRPYTTSKNLPVMVFLHGGNNLSGTANIDFTDMAVETNAVIVSVSYRLGAFGFLSHPAIQDGTKEENSGNFALLDIRQALQWVKKEIVNFGGNAGNVTLSGFSAGARDTLMCVISPLMKGLFQKAFIMSGGMTSCTPEEGQASAEEKLASILVQRGEFERQSEALDYIRSAPEETVRDLFYGLTTREVAHMYTSFELRLPKFPQGFMDGVVLPKEGFDVIRSGSYNRVPLLLGSDATEFSSFAWRDKGIFPKKTTLESLATPSFNTMDILEKSILYGSQFQTAYNVEETAAAVLRDTRHKNIYAFRFCWGTDSTVTDSFYSQYVGAYHGASRDFLLGDYPNSYKEYSPNAISSANKTGRRALTSQMRAYIKNFLVKGDPNGTSLAKWNTWSSASNSKKIMNFNAGKKAVISRMGIERYDRKLILYKMKKNLTETEYDFLINVVLKDRYFME